MQLDLFEIDRVIDDMARGYAAPCATTWFKVTNNKNPTKEEYRKKVVEFMKHFNYTLSIYPAGQESDNFRSYAKSLLQQEIERILSGNNKEVEKRYKYYVDYA